MIEKWLLIMGTPYRNCLTLGTIQQQQSTDGLTRLGSHIGKALIIDSNVGFVDIALYELGEAGTPSVCTCHQKFMAANDKKQSKLFSNFF